MKTLTYIMKYRTINKNEKLVLDWCLGAIADVCLNEHRKMVKGGKSLKRKLDDVLKHL